MGRAGVDDDGFSTPPEVGSMSVATASNSAAVNFIVERYFYPRASF